MISELPLRLASTDDPAVLAAVALGRLEKKREELVEALRGGRSTSAAPARQP